MSSTLKSIVLGLLPQSIKVHQDTYYLQSFEEPTKEGTVHCLLYAKPEDELYEDIHSEAHGFQLEHVYASLLRKISRVHPC